MPSFAAWNLKFLKLDGKKSLLSELGWGKIGPIFRSKMLFAAVINRFGEIMAALPLIFILPDLSLQLMYPKIE